MASKVVLSPEGTFWVRAVEFSSFRGGLDIERFEENCIYYEKEEVKGNLDWWQDTEEGSEG